MKFKYSTPRAFILDIKAERIVLKWSDDGNSIVALVDDEPFSMIIAEQKPGFSKAILKEGYLGHPWSATEYANAFGEHDA